MDIEGREIAKTTFGLTDQQFDEFSQKERELLIKVAGILKEELKTNPDVLEKMRLKLLIATAKYYADLKDISE